MELTVTNRSQAYPNAEKRYRENGVFEISGFRKFEARLGLKKSKKDLQKLIGCSIMLYVVLKVH